MLLRRSGRRMQPQRRSHRTNAWTSDRMRFAYRWLERPSPSSQHTVPLRLAGVEQLRSLQGRSEHTDIRRKSSDGKVQKGGSRESWPQETVGRESEGDGCWRSRVPPRSPCRVVVGARGVRHDLPFQVRVCLREGTNTTTGFRLLCFITALNMGLQGRIKVLSTSIGPIVDCSQPELLQDHDL